MQLCIGQVICGYMSLTGKRKKHSHKKNIPIVTEEFVCGFTSADPSLWSSLLVRQYEIFEVWLGTITAFGKAHIDEKFEAKKKTQ